MRRTLHVLPTTKLLGQAPSDRGWVVPNFTFHFITFQFIFHFKFHAPVGPTARSELTAKQAFSPAEQQQLAS
jgi:hypothetical protein